MFPKKKHDKTPEEELSEVERGNLSNKVFKVMIDGKDDQRSEEKIERTE